MGECHHRDIYDHPDGDGAECGYPLPCPYHGMRGALVWCPEEAASDLQDDVPPSTWLPPGADDAPVRPSITNDGRCSCGSLLYLGASRCYLCTDPPSVHHETPRTHGTYEVVDGVPTVWVRLHGPDGQLVPVRKSAAAPPAIHDCRTLPVGSKISVLTVNHPHHDNVRIVTIERAREPEGRGEKLVTSGGTLRWYPHDGCSWWPRQPGGRLEAIDVVSVSPYPWSSR